MFLGIVLQEILQFTARSFTGDVQPKSQRVSHEAA